MKRDIYLVVKVTVTTGLDKHGNKVPRLLVTVLYDLIRKIKKVMGTHYTGLHLNAYAKVRKVKRIPQAKENECKKLFPGI